MRNYLRSFLTREALGQFIRLGLIGGLNTIVYFAVFNICRFGLGLNTVWSVTWGFAVATGLSYLLNRRWTFRIRTGWGSWSESGSFYVVNGIAYVVTVAIVAGAERLLPGMGGLGLNLANVAATLVILVPKFAAYRDVVFRASLASNRRN